MKNRIDSLEAQLLNEPQVPCPVFHHFGPGIYIREMHFPAGTLVVGHEHTGESSNVFLKGRLKLLKDDGSWEELEAPQFFVGGPGRKVAIALSDCVWQNIFATTETDVQKLEEQLVRKSPAFKLKELSCHSQPLQLV